jgi:hypothetical protein
MHADGDLVFGPLDLGFEFVTDFQLVFDEVIQPIANWLQFHEWQLFEGRLDLFDLTHAKKIADFGVWFKAAITSIAAESARRAKTERCN